MNSSTRLDAASSCRRTRLTATAGSSRRARSRNDVASSRAVLAQAPLLVVVVLAVQVAELVGAGEQQRRGVDGGDARPDVGDGARERRHGLVEERLQVEAGAGDDLDVAQHALAS